MQGRKRNRSGLEANQSLITRTRLDTSCGHVSFCAGTKKMNSFCVKMKSQLFMASGMTAYAVL